MVGRALEYLDKLARQATGDRALQLELAEAYLKIGDVQGKPYTANVGDSEGALRSYGKAVEIAAPFAAQEENSQQTKARRTVGRAYVALGSVEARLSRLDAAARANEHALALAEQLLTDDPENADEWRRLAISCHQGLGDATQAGNHQRRDLGLHRTSLAHYNHALALAEELVAANPRSIADLRRLAKCCSRAAAILGEIGASTGDAKDFDEAIALHTRTVQLFRDILEREPTTTQHRRALADALVMKASAHALALRDLPIALAESGEGLRIENELAAADSSNAEAQQDLGFAHYWTARLSQLNGDRSGAAAHYRKSLAILEPLVAANPQNVETAFDLARAQRGLEETSTASHEKQIE